MRPPKQPTPRSIEHESGLELPPLRESLNLRHSRQPKRGDSRQLPPLSQLFLHPNPQRRHYRRARVARRKHGRSLTGWLPACEIFQPEVRLWSRAALPAWQLPLLPRLQKIGKRDARSIRR